MPMFDTPLPRRAAARAGLIVGLATALAAAATLIAGRAEGQTCGAHGFPNPQLLAAMKRGVNLPGWDHADETLRPTVRQLQALREEGFTHIRLPLDERRLEDEKAEAYLDAMVEQVVLLLSLDYAVSVDLHAGGAIGRRFGQDPAASRADLREMWEALARRVRFFDPAKVALELLNEPDLEPQVWRETAAELIADIRRIAPRATIVVGPAGPQRHEALAAMEPLADDNIVYAVHYYDPFAFTHQGATWGGADDPMRHLGGLHFPAEASDPAMQDRIAGLQEIGQAEAAATLARSLETPWDEALIAGAFETMRDWSMRHSAPVIVNEFGVLSFAAPRQSRLTWLAAVRREAERSCIGWAHWDFQDGFGLIDPATGMPDRGIMQALVPGD